MNAAAEVKAKPAEPSSLRLVFTLAFAGLCAGLILWAVWHLTGPRIAANKAKVLQAAVKKVVPGATQLQSFVWDDKAGTLVLTEGASGTKAVHAGYDDSGTFLGYAIPGKAGGYADIIEVIYGYDPGEHVVVGFAVLESKETPGFGDKIETDPAFLANFEALAVKNAEGKLDVKAVLHGSKTTPNQIDAVSGATISSKAAAVAIQKGNKRWLDRLDSLEPPAFVAPTGEKPAPKAQKGGAR